VLFESKDGSAAPAQIKAFEDTWHWDQGAARVFDDVVQRGGEVADVMVAGDVPTLAPDRPMRECVVLLAQKRGTVAVVDRGGSLLGVVTAGDLTRLMEKTDAFLDLPVGDVMTRTPKTTTRDELAGAAVRLMEQHGIMALPVLDGGRKLVGMVHLHDLMKAGAA